ncbi:unnamed protein product [Boreogadus saida]
MTDVEPVVTDFASTARTGRRNAISDLLGAAAGPSGSAELSNKLAELSVRTLMELVRARPPAPHSAPGMGRRRQRGSNAPPSVMITPPPLMLDQSVL